MSPATPPDDVPLRTNDGYYPGRVWRTSAPEAQGLDSQALVELFDAVEAEHLPIHSLQIVRYGHLVLDAYFHPFEAEARHDVASVTKSITTTLVGLALERGSIAGLEVPVVPLLTDSPPPDARALQIRVRDLLTTSSGLACGPVPYEREMLAMAASPDWVGYALALPMRAAPGTRFEYCSPGFHMLSALIARTTGLSTEAFAREALFGPIGITNWRWPRDPQGINQGAGDLQMRPTDLLRIGHLFLRQGEWAGRQIVPRAWIAEATRRQVDASPIDGYGFGWWLPNNLPGLYQAAGRGGQRLVVWPTKDLVVVITGGGLDVDRLAPHLLRALKSNAALPPNPAGQQRLAARVRAAAQPAAPRATASPPPLPPLAATVSGRTYLLAENALGLRALQLHFLSPTQAHVRLQLSHTEMIVPIGLDGRYRVAIDPTSDEPVAGRGRWLTPERFSIEVDTIARINHVTAELDFANDQLRGWARERSGLVPELALNGRARP
ncbi:MAG TPA: serine hydrolase [Ideonella sp.]|uniref:serine hydrolase domain-containing protein n=1 Tax=Ideonella sp. TaxID=1929293 RepID=UPI002E2FF44F|nr:serine hydrolase [Ideonella sp.]HEX5686008.1 serine hydrolase [Ideonella sp.]